jgi:hypothetical protein
MLWCADGVKPSAPNGWTLQFSHQRRTRSSALPYRTKMRYSFLIFYQYKKVFVGIT